jgi:hypothetical protein
VVEASEEHRTTLFGQNCGVLRRQSEATAHRVVLEVTRDCHLAKPLPHVTLLKSATRSQLNTVADPPVARALKRPSLSPRLHMRTVRVPPTSPMALRAKACSFSRTRRLAEVRVGRRTAFVSGLPKPPGLRAPVGAGTGSVTQVSTESGQVHATALGRRACHRKHLAAGDRGEGGAATARSRIKRCREVRSRPSARAACVRLPSNSWSVLSISSRLKSRIASL